MCKKCPDSPLHKAAITGHFDICKFIIDNVQDKNPSAVDQHGWTPLFLATLHNHRKIADYITSKIAK